MNYEGELEVPHSHPINPTNVAALVRLHFQILFESTTYKTPGSAPDLNLAWQQVLE